MRQWVVAIGCVWGLAGSVGVAAARPFNNGDLFVGRSVKHDARDRFLSAGANFQVAPVEAIIQTAVKKAIDEQAKSNPEAAKMVEYLKYVDAKQMKEFADAGKTEEFKKAMEDQMKARGQTPTPEQKAYLATIDSSKLKTMATLIEVYQNASKPAKTTTFSIEPYARLNLRWLEATAQIAIAGFHNDKGDSFELGNLGLDLHTGDAYGAGSLGFGWTTGVSVFAPTGTEDADTIALSNVLATPRFLHSYLSYAPYAVLGVDLVFVKVTARGEYVDLNPVAKTLDDKLFGAPKRMRYANVGAGLLADLGLVGISAELDGLFELENAPMVKGVWLGTFGLRTYLKVAQIGAAVQIPFVKSAKDASTSVGGANLGEIASFNVLLNAQVTL